MILNKELLEIMTKIFADLDGIIEELRKKQNEHDLNILKLKAAYGAIHEQKLKLQELRRMAGESIH